MIRFGTAGNPDSFPGKASHEAPRWLREVMGLDAYEYQCVRGVNIGTTMAERVGAQARKHDIALSIHSPYYISLTNPDALDKNLGYILASCGAAKAMGATRIVIHTGSTSGRDRSEALAVAQATLTEALRAMETSGYGGILLCPETMGKVNQLGSFEEVMTLCAEDERLLPCIDFGHLYTRTQGACEGYDALRELLDAMENAIGRERARVFHSHFSKMEYSNGGEKRHLTFDTAGEFGPDPAPLLRLLRERDYCPTIICESRGTQAEDAKVMKELYQAGR